MAYLARNHKDNSSGESGNSKRSNVQNNSNKSSENNEMLVKRTKTYNNKGYKAKNNYAQNDSESQLGERLQRAKEKQKKEAAKKAIVTGLNAVAPGAGTAAEAALKTEKGEKLLDAYAKGENHAEGIKNVKNEIEKDAKKRMLILAFFGFFLPILILIILMSVIFKNADSQIFSNENGGTVESENYGYDDTDTNIFANYPGLYEKVMTMSDKVGDKYKIEIDKYLIIATLIAPIDNGLITPVKDGTCGEDECYKFNGESLTWTEFLDSWGDQSELLAKMQIMTYVNPASNIDVTCGEDETMEQYAQNDLEINTFPWWGWLNPVNWFKGFTDAVKAEVNAKCTEVPSGKTKVPTVYVLSTEPGDYYLTNNANNEYEYIKDPESGGVYFWNLVNKNGFIHQYLKDYLSDEFSDDPDKNYEINKDVIVSTTNYIYSYYDSIRKDCEGHKILESTIEKIKVYNPPDKQSQYGLAEIEEVEFEDQYVGGVMLAEYNSGDMESLKAFAILARTEAVATVGMDGSGTIENSSNDQNYNPEYTPEKFPRIAEAVKATRGMVVSKYKSPEVWHTVYDAFCPVRNVLEGEFYYLDDEQQNLPINPSAFEALTGKQFINPDNKYLDCPCFQNNHSRPHDEEADDENTRYHTSSTEAPTYAGGTPSQTTKDVCWTYQGTAPNGKYAWKYKPSGGHGQGASQYGLKYFGAFGYDQDALLRLFFPGASVRLLSSSLEDGKCSNIPFYTGEVSLPNDGSSSDDGDLSYSNGKTLYLGDSRTADLVGSEVIERSDTVYGIGYGYNWLIGNGNFKEKYTNSPSGGIAGINAKLSNGGSYNIVIWLGVNDYTYRNASTYFDEYAKLANGEWSNHTLYVVSVGPVDDSKSKGAKNAGINAFNSQMESLINESGISNLRYIDLNFTQSSISHYDSEGLHYGVSDYRNIYSIISRNIG